MLPPLLRRMAFANTGGTGQCKHTEKPFTGDRALILAWDMRPMGNSPRAMEDLKAILDSRTPLYAKAEIAISTTGKTPENALAELLRAAAVPDNRMTRRSA